ncbi:hypothetical protein [Solidesulfovibrio sp.]|uniref:rhamnosyltransferase WsaF family glycosyltransferase n=1 Tax=Solidesulfovibrio sp. TaxID=2910990 RepID=UPI002621983B|nr:hypothetical protein [Solidesulfovibrio sp.]
MSQAARYDPGVFAATVLDPARLRLESGPRPPRLTVCLPHLHKDHVFGGLGSVLELARFLAPHYPEVRFLSLTPLPGQADRLDAAACLGRRDGPPPEVVSLHDDATLTVHGGDVFLCTFWRAVPVWEAFSDLLRRAGRPVNPFYYFIQDWEPGFYPMSLDHMLAEATYGHGQACTAVVNSLELARFLAKKRYALGQVVALRPSLNPVLAEALSALGRRLPARPADRLNILVYGRPGHHRNCFPALLACLWAWLSAFRPARALPVNLVSAGTPHEDVAFPDGSTLVSHGMLSLPDYVATLLQSHVGLSFMASPHPSYPPLEMAAFGLEVVTNAYPCKDLSKGHPAVRNAPMHRPAAAAAVLDQAAAAALAGAGAPRRSVLPESLSPDGWQANFRRAGIPILAPAV